MKIDAALLALLSAAYLPSTTVAVGVRGLKQQLTNDSLSEEDQQQQTSDEEFRLLLEERELSSKCDDDNDPCHLLPGAAQEWCECVGGDNANAFTGQICYDDFEEDCFCDLGYLQERNDCRECNLLFPTTWCQAEADENGFAAIARAGRDCYDDFEDDCMCIAGFRQTRDGCMDCFLDVPNTWCVANAESNSNQAFARPGQDCYDDFEEDCLCANGFRVNDDGCEDCNLNDPDRWCRDRGGDQAFALDDQSCYDDFDDDCDCQFGFRVTSDGCENCFLNDPDGWCRQFDPIAFALPDESCYNRFRDDCQCPEGFVVGREGCDIDCHEDDPDEFCREEGGDGAFSIDDLDCYTDFEQHCGCFEGYTMQGATCVDTGLDTTRLDRVQHVANDDHPANRFPLGLCQGDCDSDSDCQGYLECYMRDENEAVPGCFGGETENFDYDYCIRPPTPSPTEFPTADPATPTPPPVATPAPVTPTPPPTTPPPTTPPPTMPMMTMEPARVPPPPSFLLPMPPASPGTTMYDVRYLGRFQKIEEPGCSFPAPEVVAGCVGTIGMVGTSDPSIVCDSPITNADGTSQVTCRNTCVGDACLDVYLGPDMLMDFQDLRLFGEVFFQCMGTSVSDVEGWFSVMSEGGGEGTCGGTNAAGVGAAFQTAQLGVYGAMVDSYIGDSHMAECNTESQSVSIQGVYSCTWGQACYDAACAFTMEPLRVSTDIYRFPNQFIRTNDRSALPPIPYPQAPTTTDGETAATFQVNIGFFYDEAVCSGTVSQLRMTCTDGAISLVENQSGMDCTTEGTNALVCNEGLTPFARNQYTGVVRYDCTATNRVPQTSIETTGTTIDCSRSAIQQPVSLEAQLGVVCDGDMVGYDDILFECNPSSLMISRDQEFTCGIAGTLQVSRDAMLFGPVGVATDPYRWATMSDMCVMMAGMMEEDPTSTGTLTSSGISGAIILSAKNTSDPFLMSLQSVGASDPDAVASRKTNPDSVFP